MSRIRRFLDLDSYEQALLSIAFFLVWAIRLALWFLPFRSVHEMVLCGTRRSRWKRMAVGSSPDKVVWAVRLASRYVPSATCLTQALAAYLMLSWIGEPASLFLGVLRTKVGAFQAHAWVELEGQVVIGDLRNFSEYVPLRLMDGADL